MTNHHELANDPIEPIAQQFGSESMMTVSSMADFARLWQMAFNASSDMISILDTNHRIIAVNTAMANATGYTPDQPEGICCYQLYHQTDETPLSCPHKALLEDGKTHQSEIYEERLDTWLLITVTPLYNHEKALIGSIHIARDITQRKRLEQARRESEERYHHLSEATTDGVLLSEESTIIAANQVLADMMGYSMKELRGMDMLKFVAPDDRNRLIQSLGSSSSVDNTFEYIRKDGSTFAIESHSRAVTYKGSMVYQTAIRDLTEQKRSEQERIRHERMQGVLEMAGAVCHEINQPLMALQGYMEILAAKIEPKNATAKNIHNMEKQIERIKKLIHKMKHIGQYETKDYPGGEKIIDIHQATTEDQQQ